MNAGDEELIRLAREALAPPSVEPPLESIAALREAVDRLSTPGAGRRRRAWRFRLATAVAGFLTLASGTAAAAAVAGASLPAPLRGIAHGIGLPVDSAGLAQAKTDAGRLSYALRQRDVPMIGRDAAALETTFKRLDAGDQRSIDERVDALLNQAAAYSGGQQGGSEGSGSGATSGEGGGGEVSGGSGDSSPSTTLPGTVAPVSGSGGGGSADGGGDRSSSSTTSTTSTTVPQGSGDGRSGGSDGGSVSGTSGG